MTGSRNDRRPDYSAWVTSDRPVPRLVIRPLAEFLQTESGGSVLLLVATIGALVWANSPWGGLYERLWHTEASLQVGGYEIRNDLRDWINEALMAVFFFVVGLELKRELLDGELRHAKRAALPVAAALGGMVLPAAIYISLNRSAGAVTGWGIPMATDIAFVLGALALIPRVPSGIKTFLLTLAIVDDIGAILVIALFYSGGIEWRWLAVAVTLLAAILVVRWLHQHWRYLNLLGVDALHVIWLLSYAALAIGVWLAIFESGVHATIAGVALAFTVRATGTSEPDDELEEHLDQADEELSPAERLEHFLHPWTSYGVIPLFALANAGVRLDADAFSRALTSTVTLGIVGGLVVGKLVGITAFSMAAVRLKIGLLPPGVRWSHVVGAGALAGIGFTVSLFIAGLAFAESPLEAHSKVGVMTGSLIAAGVGAGLLRLACRGASRRHHGGT